MATRPVYYISGGKVCSRDVEFEWFAGFSVNCTASSPRSLSNTTKHTSPQYETVLPSAPFDAEGLSFISITLHSLLSYQPQPFTPFSQCDVYPSLACFLP